MLEPGAGSGNIIKTLQKYGDFSIDAVEIRPEEAQHLQDLGVNVIIDDFLSMDLGKKYDLIIGRLSCWRITRKWARAASCS